MSPLPGAAPIRTVVHHMPGAADPLALYAALTGGGSAPGTFLLESADAGTATGERSILGVSCALRIACSGRSVLLEAGSDTGRELLPRIAGRLSGSATLSSGEGTLRASFPREPDGGGREPRAPGRGSSPLQALRAVMLESRCEDAASEDLFLAGGVFSYDLIDLVEDLPPGRDLPAPPPDFEFFLQDRLVIVDHRRRTTLLVAHGAGGGPAGSGLREAVRALRRVARTARDAAPSFPLRRGVPQPPEGGAAPARVAVDLSDRDFASLVSGLRPHLDRGDVYQIVPSRTFTAPCRDPLAAYAELRSRDPSPYLFFARTPGHAILGASPETCVKVTPSPSRLTLRPIAGTAARGRSPGGGPDPEADVRREAALLLDPKETAEHMMLVDLARNDAARVSRPGTRRVTRLMEVERYAHVMHMVSEVQGDLREGLDALDAYAACMNPGTLVGAPKLRAARILREVEPSRRGVFGGAVGYLTRRGRMDTAIAIRTAVVRDATASVRAGAGVVLDSDPDSEAMETRRKAAAVLEAVTAAEAGHA